MSDIPCDISREIFILLPSKSLIRFRAVCKLWRSIIDDPCFVKAHTQKQQSLNTILIRNSTGPPSSPLISVDLDTLNPTHGIHSIPTTPLCFTPSGLSRLLYLPVATCNGLMLIHGQNWWEIWNPLTHERLELPQRALPSATSRVSSKGIGYDYTTDDYKAVLIFCDPSAYPLCYYETHVYSLKLDSWKRIYMNFPCGDCWFSNHDDGVFVSGSLHWISSKNVIIALDMGTENYSQLKFPPIDERDIPDIIICHQQLEVLGGRLILFDYGKDDWGFQHYDVWAMNDYGSDESWTRLFSVGQYKVPDLSSNLRPIAYMKNKMQVLLTGLSHGSGLCIFDVESNSAKSFSIHELKGALSVQVFHETIFRLHDNCGVVSGSVVPPERRIQKEKMKICHDHTKLIFCIMNEDDEFWYHSHDSCFGIYSNWCCSSSEDED